MRSLLSRIVLALSLALLVLSAAGCSSVSKPEDFVITDGVLTEYTGKAKDIVIPGGVTALGKGVFKESKIKTVVIPDSVKVVGYEAFFGCGKLTKVSLPDNGIILESRSFNYCYKLTDMPIPDTAEVHSHAITNFNDTHYIQPAPEMIVPGGQINYLSGITLCNMQFTGNDELRLTFVQGAGDMIPITFNADGTISADYKIGFSVQLRMDDGSVISTDRYEILLDADRNEYRYRLYYTTSEKPKDILVNGTKESFVLNGKTYAEYKNWEKE